MDDNLAFINDDVMLELFEYCDFKTLLKLAKAFDRFKLLLKDFLQKDWKDVTIKRERVTGCNTQKVKIYQATLKQDEMKLIFDITHPCIETLKLEATNGKMLRILKNCTFPNLQKLQILHGSEAYEMSIEFELSFPNLKDLSMQGVWVKSSCNPKLPALEQLDLSGSVLSKDKFTEFLKVSKLKTLTSNVFGETSFPLDAESGFACLQDLEVLTLNLQEIVVFENTFGHMKKLKKLNLMFRNSIRQDLVALNSDFPRITSYFKIVEVRASTLSFPRVDFENFLESTLRQMQRLRLLQKFTLITREWEFLDMWSSRLQLLKELILVGVYLNADILGNILSNSKQIEVLTLKCCTSIFETIMVDLGRAERGRTMPLIINVHNFRSYILPKRPINLKTNGESNLIQIIHNYHIILNTNVIFEYIMEPRIG